jgi:hypothetical protein
MPIVESETVRVILTISSILFGFLAGFFISELWTRYSEIRSLQGTRSAQGINMVKYGEYFFKNKRFKKEFLELTEKSSIVDEIIEWNEGHLEIPYYQAISRSFVNIKDSDVKTARDSLHYARMLDTNQSFNETTIKLDMLGKERLFAAEWILMIVLSLIIALSVLFIAVTSFFYQIVVLVFPAIIAVALIIIHDLDSLSWSKETVSLEPNERIFDAIGVKRFYLKKKKKYISSKVKDYRTEDDLKGELKKLYLDIQKQRKV